MKTVTFDVDGILIPHVKYICEKYSIDFKKITKYNISECELLSDKEKNIIIKSFSDVRIFEEAGFIPETIELDIIARHAILKIDSLSANDEIREFKRQELKRLIPSLKDENICLRIYEADNLKCNIDKTDIFVDDSIANLTVNYNRYGKAYTILTKYNEENSPSLGKVKVMASVQEIIRTIIKSDLGL